MQKFFILISLLLLSAVAASAQTAGDRKPLVERKQVEAVKNLEDSGVVKPANASYTRTEVETNEKRTEVLRVIDGRVLRLGPSTTYLQNGLSAEEVLRLLGKPVSVSERQEGEMRLSVYTFQRSEGRVLVAEFEDGVLVRSRTERVEGLARSR